MIVAPARTRMRGSAGRQLWTVPRINTLLGRSCDEISMITAC